MNHFQRIFHFKCFTKFFLLTSNQLAYIMSIIFSGISFKYLIKFLFWNNWAIELNHRVVFTLVIPTQWNKERKKKIGGKCRNTLKIYSHLYKISKMYISLHSLSMLRMFEILSELYKNRIQKREKTISDYYFCIQIASLSTIGRTS